MTFFIAEITDEVVLLKDNNGGVMEFENFDDALIYGSNKLEFDFYVLKVVS